MNFEYNEVAIPEDGIFKISPSKIADFFDMPVIWYKENVLKEKTFTNSTATVLGTIIHAIAEAYAKGEPTSREEIEEYLVKTAKEQPVTEEVINKEEIRNLYPDMGNALINEYVRHNKPTLAEEEVCYHVAHGVYVAGTTDNVTGDIVGDYKNVSKKPPETIPFKYKIQLLSYAKGMIEKGHDIRRIRIIYTVRPTKTLPVRVFVVTHQITQEDWKLLNDTLHLIADTIAKIKEDPSLAYLLFKSYDLKEK